MKAKSLSVFRTKLRQDDSSTVLVSIGDVIEGDEDHLRALARNRLVEIIDDGTEKNAKAAKPKAEPKPKTNAKPGVAAKAAKPKAENPAPEKTEGNVESQDAPKDGEGEE